MKVFIYKCYMPTLKLVHTSDAKVMYEVRESFYALLIQTNYWGVLEATVVHTFTVFIHHSMGIIDDESLGSRSCGTEHTSKNCGDIPFGHYSLAFSCYVLTSMLDVAVPCCKATKTSSEVTLSNELCYAEIFTKNLLRDLCGVAIKMLSGSIEHRSHVIRSLLPSILNAFVSHDIFDISHDSDHYILSRNSFFKKLWTSCEKLFSMGSMEGRDAYNILSLYFSHLDFTPCGSFTIHPDDEKFDLRFETGFLDQIRRGLVNKGSLVRKQCLHILKIILQINDEHNDTCFSVSEKERHGNDFIIQSMSKRGHWADKEAKSLGVGKKTYSCVGGSLTGWQRWNGFILLYEMLEEYGTHLVESAWEHQVDSFLRFYSKDDDSEKSTTNTDYFHEQMNTLKGMYSWLVILLERGLFHDNPQVRCLIMKSFLGFNWNNNTNSAKMVPEHFILGPFLLGLNDPVHHKDFGGNGKFSSNIIDDASGFIQHYASNLSWREGIEFLVKLSSVFKVNSFGRAGLMCFARCIFSAAGAIRPFNFNKMVYDCNQCEENSMENHCDSDCDCHNLRTTVLDNLWFVLEKICESVLEAAAIVVYVDGISPGILMHFISAFPREFTEYGGVLRPKIQNWILGPPTNHHNRIFHPKAQILEYIFTFSTSFINEKFPSSLHIATCDDEELAVIEAEAKKWSRLFFLAVNEDDDIEPFFWIIKNHWYDITDGGDFHCGRKPIKLLLLFSAMIQELQLMWQKINSLRVNSPINEDFSVSSGVHVLLEKFSEFIVSIMEILLSFSIFSHSLLKSKFTECDEDLPPSVLGRLGGPSQRRLSYNTTCVVLQAVTSIKVISSSVSWLKVFKPNFQLESVFTFLFDFFLDIISRSPCESEAASEITLSEYEALTDVLKTLSSYSPPALARFIRKSHQSRHTVVEGNPSLDGLLLSFLKGVRLLIYSGHLTKSRCAVLMKAKWFCVESLLSISISACSAIDTLILTEATVNLIFEDLIESLESASEDSILTLFGSVRLILSLYGSGNLLFMGNSTRAVDTEMMWKLVRSSWVTYVNWSKRRVTAISALLSAVFHDSVFSDIGMHVCGDAPGPLKWFVGNIVTEGIKSPRTMRLATINLCKLWLCNPNILKHYVAELKLLSLHGSVTIDEDMEAELPISIEFEISDCELTQVFLNTELYTRVTIAILFYKLANVLDMAKSRGETLCIHVLESGKLFLMGLLESVVKDQDLSKELYKKYCSIHRRKVRAWQMMSVLSRFIDDEVIGRVRDYIHICIQRNNLPSVRQYIEIFAVHMYLKFPKLVKEELVPMFLDSRIKPQALSSYVFIAANVILHSKEVVRYRHFDDLLPAVIPFLTSHHHSLRGFTQLLVHQVLFTFCPRSESCESYSLENKCLQGIMDYLENNPDCMRLRTSMKRYLDEFDPISFSTPFGIFTKHLPELDFECVPVSLMDRVLNFLNDVRDDLRSSMARDLITLTDENKRNSRDEYTSFTSEEQGLNFQRKFTVPTAEIHKQLLEFEKEDDLFEHLCRSRNLVVESMRESRQPIIVVASLVDRIPNLAGLTRTCEIFKAAGLAICDKKILQDKQYQLISVTAEKWVPIIEVRPNNLKEFLEKKREEGFCLVGLEQTAKSIPLHRYTFPQKMVLVVGAEREGIRVDIIHGLDECIEIPQLGVVRALNVHVSAAVALWEYTRQHGPLH